MKLISFRDTKTLYKLALSSISEDEYTINLQVINMYNDEPYLSSEVALLEWWRIPFLLWIGLMHILEGITNTLQKLVSIFYQFQFQRNPNVQIQTQQEKNPKNWKSAQLMLIYTN